MPSMSIPTVLLALAIVLMLLATRPALATSTTVFEMTTTETHQVSVLTESGVRPTIGWTLNPDGTMQITLAVKASALIGSYSWIGVGVSATSGLGTSRMIGGEFGGAAVVGRFGVLETPVKEYQMLGKQPNKVLNWLSTGPTVATATRCGADFCSPQVSQCFGQPLCKGVLQCAQANYVSVGNNKTVGEFISQCTATITNPSDPVQVAAVSSLLDASGCFVANCGQRLRGGVHVTNLNTSSLVQDGSGATLSFKVNNRRIAHMILGGRQGDRAMSFLVAFAGPAGPGNAFIAHSVGSQAAATVNLLTGEVTVLPTPDWLVSHIAVSIVGLAILLPVGVVLRAWRFPGWISSSLTLMAFFLGVAGSVIVSSSDPDVMLTFPHAIIGIIAISLAALLSLLACLKPSHVSARARAWQDRLVGESEKQDLYDIKREFRQMFGFFMTLTEMIFLGLVCLCMFLGVNDVMASSVRIPTNLSISAIVGTAVCLLAVILTIVAEALRRRRARMARDAVKSAMEGDVEKMSASSQNPKFKTENEMGAIAAGDEDAARAAALSVVPLILSWENVSIRAPVRDHSRDVDGRLILKQAWGFCGPCTLTACLGPSGAGKSSLMETLCLRSQISPEYASSVCINGIPANVFPQLARYIGFVPQQDVLHQHLTVLETLQFCSNMMLPSTMSEEHKVERVLRVVVQLGIGHVLDTLVGGGDLVRGLSGGERRRVSIAIQMIKSPSILFMDEPTSGLDAHASLKLVEALRELANEGRTIFATIHQPSTACFELFDRVVLLSGGNTVWSGSRTGALQFFKEQNRAVPASWNPADWYLTVVDYNKDDRFAREESAQGDVRNNNKRQSYRASEEAERAVSRIFNNTRKVDTKTALAVSTATSSMNLDVSELRDSVKEYYKRVNPKKLSEDPGVVEEIVKFALIKGIDAVEAKMFAKYSVSILPFLHDAVKRKAASQSADPMTKDQLTAMVVAFSSSLAGKELTDRINKVHTEALSLTSSNSPQKMPNSMFMSMASDGGGKIEDVDNQDYAQTFFTQIRLLAKRSVTLAMRNPNAFKFQAFQNVVFGLLLGSLYSNIKTYQSSVAQYAIAMAIILAMVAFVTLSLGTQVAFSDRLVFEREVSDHMYSPYAHFAQRLIVGVPLASIIASCLIIPAYFWIQLRPDGGSFFFFFLVNVGVVFLFDSVVFALTLIANDVNVAYQLGNFYEALTIFFSGVFIPVFAMPVYYQWLYFISPFAYAFAGVAINEFEGSESDFFLITGGIVIKSKWANFFILMAMGMIWRVLGLYGVVRIYNKRKMKLQFVGHGVNAAVDRSDALIAPFMNMQPPVPSTLRNPFGR